MLRSWYLIMRSKWGSEGQNVMNPGYFPTPYSFCFSGFNFYTISLSELWFLLWTLNSFQIHYYLYYLGQLWRTKKCPRAGGCQPLSDVGTTVSGCPDLPGLLVDLISWTGASPVKDRSEHVHTLTPHTPTLLHIL